MKTSNNFHLPLLLLFIGQYQSWSPGFSSSKASTFVASTLALVNTVPFVVGVAADCLIGDYWASIIVLIVFFVPGSLLIFLSSWPNLLGGGTFPFKVFKTGMIYLYPMGGGGVDTLLDIFAAKQYHPLLQDDQIEKFFIWAFVANAAGGTLATVGFAMIANVSITGSFFFMLLMISIATFLFCVYSKRYVVRRLQHKWILLTWRAALESVFCWKKSSEEGGKIVPALPGFEKVKETKGGNVRDDLVDAAKRLLMIIPVQGIFIPFSIPYTQVLTFMIPQSFSMSHPPLWSGTSMSTVMNISSVLAGISANKFFYPYLERKNIVFCTTRRVALGASLLTVSYLVMYGVDQKIRRVYADSGDMISIGWQGFVYGIMGIAYVFFLPPMDELTFRVAPNEYKVLGNAINKFIQAGIGAFIAKAIYSGLESWMTPTNGDANIMNIAAYTTAKTDNFMLLMAAISAFQALFLLIPFVENWVKRVEDYVKIQAEAEAVLAS